MIINLALCNSLVKYGFIILENSVKTYYSKFDKFKIILLLLISKNRIIEENIGV